jgi:hypothetical protein
MKSFFLPLTMTDALMASSLLMSVITCLQCCGVMYGSIGKEVDTREVCYWITRTAGFNDGNSNIPQGGCMNLW